MSWAAAAVAGGAVVGGLLSSKGAGDAADSQERASTAAIGEQARQYDQSRADLSTYRNAGNAATESLMSKLGLQGPSSASIKGAGDLVLMTGGGPILNPKYEGNPDAQRAWNETLAYHNQQLNANGYKTDSDPTWIMSQMQARMQGGATEQPSDFGELNQKFTVGDFMKDPVTELGLKYGLDLGTKAIDRGAGAAGLRNSGATLKALTRFGQDYAGSKAGESSARFYGDQDRIFNRLSGLAGTGQTATTTGVMAGQNYAGNVGNILTAQGNARGAAAIGQANAYGGALNTIGNFYGQQATLDKIMAGRAGGQNGGGRTASTGLYDIS